MATASVFRLGGETVVLPLIRQDRLLDRLAAGDERAFETLYDRHQRPLLSFCRQMLGSPEDAEDALQQTFLAAYRELVGGTRPRHLRAWLYGVARNRCLAMLRSRPERARWEVDGATAAADSEAEQRAELAEILRDISLLPEEQRAALVLFELGDLRQSEIARVLCCREGKVKALVFQARSALIGSRDARQLPCSEVREQLSTLRGGALRRRPLRRHLGCCEGCAEFYAHVRRQRRAVAALLPVLPSAELKSAVLAGVGCGGASPGGAGIVVGFLAAAGPVKLVALSLAVTGTVVTASAAGDRLFLPRERVTGFGEPAPRVAAEPAAAPRSSTQAAKPPPSRSGRTAGALPAATPPPAAPTLAPERPYSAAPPGTSRAEEHHARRGPPAHANERSSHAAPRRAPRARGGPTHAGAPGPGHSCLPELPAGLPDPALAAPVERCAHGVVDTPLAQTPGRNP